MARVSACGCGGADISPTGVRIPSGPYSLVRCARCGRRMLDPIPSDTDLAAAYNRQYYGEGESKFIAPIEAFVEHFRGSRAREAERLTSGIARVPGEPRRVLDIGCGSGQFLARLIPLLGMRLTEPSFPRRRAAGRWPCVACGCTSGRCGRTPTHPGTSI